MLWIKFGALNFITTNHFSNDDLHLKKPISLVFLSKWEPIYHLLLTETARDTIFSMYTVGPSMAEVSMHIHTVQLYTVQREQSIENEINK